MASLSEKLNNLYGNPGKREPESTSWIPKRLSNDPLGQFKKTHEAKGDLSQVRSEEILADQNKPAELAAAAKNLLELKLHTNETEKQMESFLESFANLSDIYGEMLVVALDDFIKEEVDFVHFTGFIKKDLLKRKVKEITKARKKTKRQ